MAAPAPAAAAAAAGPAPLAPVVARCGLPLSPMMLVFFESGCAFVRGTADALPWKHNAAAGNAAATSTLPTFVLIRVFFSRCSIGPTAADLSAAAGISVFDLVLTGTAWSRILTEYVSSGLLAINCPKPRDLIQAVLDLALNNPNHLALVAADWIATAPFDVAGVAGVAAQARVPAVRANRAQNIVAQPAVPAVQFLAAIAARPGPAALRFLYLLKLPRTIDESLAGPMLGMSILAGMAGPVYMYSTRDDEMSTVRTVGEVLRSNLSRHLNATTNAPLSDATLASQLSSFVVSSYEALGSVFAAPAMTEAELSSEAMDALQFSLGDAARRETVVARRIRLVDDLSTNLSRFVLTPATSSHEAYGAFNRMCDHFLTADQRRGSFHERLAAVEEKVTRKAALFAAAAATAGITVPALITKVLSDLDDLDAHGGGLTSPGGGSSTQEMGFTPLSALREDLIQQCLVQQSFLDLVQAMAPLDSHSSEGRLQILDAAFQSRHALVGRLLLKGEDGLARRHPILSTLYNIRGDLGDYIAYCQAVDPSLGLRPNGLGIVPTRARSWTYNNPTSGEPCQNLKQLMAFSVEKMAIHDGDHSMYYLKGLLTNKAGRIAAIHELDYYTIITAVEDWSDFMHRTIVAIGGPDVVQPPLAGYTIKTFCDFYLKHIKIALTLNSLREQVVWLAKAAKDFRLFIGILNGELKRFFGSARPAEAVFHMVMPIDARPPTNMKDREASLNVLADGRELFDWIGGESSSALVDAHVLPLLSENQKILIDEGYLGQQELQDLQKRTKKKAKKGKGEDEPSPKLQRVGNGGDKGTTAGGGGQPHGSNAYLWLFLSAQLLMRGKTLESGRVWKLGDIAKDFKVQLNKVCWPFILSMREPKNRVSDCNGSGDDHKLPDSAAHKLIPGFDPKDQAIVDKYSRPPTAEEVAKMVAHLKANTPPPPSYKGKGSGRGGGKGGRGPGAKPMNVGGKKAKKLRRSADSFSILTSEGDPTLRSAWLDLTEDLSLAVRMREVVHPPIQWLDALGAPLSAGQPILRSFRLSSRQHTPSTELSPCLRPLQSAVQRIGGELFDCGGQGRCGADCVGFGLVGLDRLDLTMLPESLQFNKADYMAKAPSGDHWMHHAVGELLRDAVILHSLDPSVLSALSYDEDNGSDLITMSQLMVESMSSWVTPAHLVTANTTECTPYAWSALMSNKYCYTDTAFFVLAADRFQVRIIIHLVGGQDSASAGLPVGEPWVIRPRIGVEASAELHLACVADEHVVFMGHLAAANPRTCPTLEPVLLNQPSPPLSLLGDYDAIVLQTALPHLFQPPSVESCAAVRELERKFRAQQACERAVQIAQAKQVRVVLPPSARPSGFDSDDLDEGWVSDGSGWSRRSSSAAGNGSSLASSRLTSGTSSPVHTDGDPFCCAPRVRFHSPLVTVTRLTVRGSPGAADDDDDNDSDDGIEIRCSSCGVSTCAEATGNFTCLKCKDTFCWTCLYDHGCSLFGDVEIEPSSSAFGFLRPLPPAAEQPIVAPAVPAIPWQAAFTALAIPLTLEDFTWPITTVEEFIRLLGCPDLAPTDIVGFEFSGAVREELEARGRRAISVDTRDCVIGGMHAKLDIRLVVYLKVWERAYFFPPCFQQMRCDDDCLPYKKRDGRAFWGCATVLYCMCTPAVLLFVEQPDTIMADHFQADYMITRSSAFGDKDCKYFRLFLRNTVLVPPFAIDRSRRKPSRSPRPQTYPDPDARDRAKSTWRRFPRLTSAVAALTPTAAEGPPPLAYAEVIERFACSWHKAGLPVPRDYLAPDAQPTSQWGRDYQLVRLYGDGRTPEHVIPVSMRKPSPYRVLGGASSVWDLSADYTSVSTLLIGYSPQSESAVMLLAQHRRAATTLGTFNETREMRDASPVHTALRGLAEELLGAPEQESLWADAALKPLVAALERANVSVPHLGRSSDDRHRSYVLNANWLFEGGIDEAAGLFALNDECVGVYKVPLDGDHAVTGKAGEHRVWDEHGHSWPLLDDRHLGERRVSQARTLLMSEEFLSTLAPAMPPTAPPAAAADPPTSAPVPPKPRGGARFAERLEPQAVSAEQIRSSIGWSATTNLVGNYLMQEGDTQDQLVAGKALRRAALHLPPAAVTAASESGSEPDSTDASDAEPMEVDPAPAQAPVLDVRAASSAAVVLIFVSVLMQPFVFAHLNGFTIYGAEFPAIESRPSCLAAAQKWANLAVGGGALAFMAGEYVGGARVMVAPLDLHPPEEQLVRAPAQRRARLAAGATFLWCTLAALAGTPIGDVAARAIVATESFVKPGAILADFPSDGDGLVFRFGAMPTTSVLARPLLDRVDSPPAWRALALDARWGTMLRDALVGAGDDPLLAGWADRICPIARDEISDALMARLPGFADAGLENQPFGPVYRPLVTPWLPLPPPQRPASPDAPACIASPYEMMTEETQKRVKDWLAHTLQDLVRVRDSPPDAHRDRPRPLAVGQQGLHPWARGVVWDCRAACCVVSDFTVPIKTHLKLDFFRDELQQRTRCEAADDAAGAASQDQKDCTTLADYPDQHLVANLLDGVRLDADVELQSVFVPHLVSLPLGYASVAKELDRLHGLGWYRLFADLPFWPIYLNGQGATARKLEPDRYRRTTEGGGPRQPTFDESGLQALSINTASHLPHVPLHFASDDRPEMHEWLRRRGLFPEDSE